MLVLLFIFADDSCYARRLLFACDQVPNLIVWFSLFIICMQSGTFGQFVWLWIAIHGQTVQNEWWAPSVPAFLQRKTNSHPLWESWERSRSLQHYEVDVHYTLRLHVGEGQGGPHFFIAYLFTVTIIKSQSKSEPRMVACGKCFDTCDNCVHCIHLLLM